MKLHELINELHFENLTGGINLDREIQSGYTSDLLSDVIANVGENAVWITVQRHVNILGVAKLRDVCAIIIPRTLHIEDNVIEKARNENIAVLRDHRSAFEISGLIYNFLNSAKAG
jgi:serine kinase of HPr protein (carbohydrate metabolism regulator)